MLRELPFGRYYGGVDTTPLCVYLAWSYADRTGDDEFVERMWDSPCAAIGWMEDVRHLAVGEAKVDLNFERVGDRVVCYLGERHEGLVPLLVCS
ncbi:hypothetical protein LB565_07075 [Mesorhizobium sp. CA14]|uniref:hypothetical protein n=1 Tax=Mesorhizobium sp. CA14 TaxID=2876642 RepID=UPI001CCDBEDE|nr:hypothetical protein [Mesorhizobium sp. CA14]MBZ9847747.1 hypothetical protein [Mesorhizobium sp. CA14]